MFGHGQGQDKGVRINVAAGEVQEASDGNGQDEKIDQKEVEREKPQSLFQVFFVDIFNHCHLKLPG